MTGLSRDAPGNPFSSSPTVVTLVHSMEWKEGCWKGETCFGEFGVILYDPV